ncbi:MAG: B12-binding domain-containing radical SAM protein [Caulobacteraceae bacterium]
MVAEIPGMSNQVARAHGGGADVEVVRRILLVFPHYTPSFGTFEYAYPLVGAKAFMPPQGLLVIASVLPGTWEVRFVDENLRRATAEDFAWADAVFVSGMHIQRSQINDINRRAHAAGRTTALGGPSVSACPDYYPEFDYLHVGEMGDATDALIAQLAADPMRPPTQVVFTTQVRRDLAAFPLPAYELAELPKYFMGSIQFSSGCPYDCEFCDIPALYGRNPRLKTPEQVCAELDKLREHGLAEAIYFVDDNFIGNRRAVRELLPALADWQKRNGYPYRFACEATLNIAKRPEILGPMREAAFHTIFCGIETPEPEALKAMDKGHNMMVPILEGVETLNSYGMEVVSGIIMGLDTDGPETTEHILNFVRASNIPVLTINLLQALPRTRLWDRLKAEGRLIEDEAGLESNVLFRLPYADVVAGWRECMAQSYDPEALFARFEHQIEATYAHRLVTPRKVAWKDIRRGIAIIARVLWTCGVKADYRRTFWKFAWPRLKVLDIERVISVGVVAHHLISFAREASSGRQNASFYSRKLREGETPVEKAA